jgi:hypothetical protein
MTIRPLLRISLISEEKEEEKEKLEEELRKNKKRN